ncbi:MAG: hypothetical protein HKM93_18650 [Desulfobacteraceae bacterium]|nr:hypothetical protein [Desulfobacteraceae bacterium]
MNRLFGLICMMAVVVLYAILCLCSGRDRTNRYNLNSGRLNPDPAGVD